MLLWLEDVSGNDIGVHNHITRTNNYCNLIMINGLVAIDCVDILKEIRDYLNPNQIIDFKTRLADAKRHAKLALAKKMILSDRIWLIIESFDILLGREEFFVPSTKNTINQLNQLIILCQENPNALVRVR